MLLMTTSSCMLLVTGWEWAFQQAAILANDKRGIAQDRHSVWGSVMLIPVLSKGFLGIEGLVDGAVVQVTG
jgi:hypothetical protein